MSAPSTPSTPLPLTLLRFGVRVLRVTASTIALVAAVQRHWIPAAAFAVAWLLVVGAPRLFPLLAEEP